MKKKTIGKSGCFPTLIVVFEVHVCIEANRNQTTPSKTKQFLIRTYTPMCQIVEIFGQFPKFSTEHEGHEKKK